MKLLIHACIAAAVLSFAASSTQATLINGGFDDYTNEAHQLNLDAATPASWIDAGVADPQIENTRSAITPQSGDFFLIFSNSTGGGTVSQSFTTVAGAEYELSFYLARPNANQAPTVDVDVFDGGDFSGISLLDESVLVNYADDTWVQSTFSFTATSIESTLRFVDAGTTSSVDATIDTVVITELTSVPEPSSIVIASISLLCLGGWLGWRRRK